MTKSKNKNKINLMKVNEKNFNKEIKIFIKFLLEVNINYFIFIF